MVGYASLTTPYKTAQYYDAILLTLNHIYTVLQSLLPIS